MKKHILIFGAIPGLIWIGLQLFTVNQLYTNPNLKTNDILGYVIMILVFSLIFFGVRDYRNKKLGGIISFGKAFKAGILMSVVASVVYVAVWLVCYYLFVPDFIEVYGQYCLDNNLANAEYIESLKKWYENPLGIIFITALEVLPMGLFAALISALVLKKKQKNN